MRNTDRPPLRDRSNSDPRNLSPSRRERHRVDGRKPATCPRDAVAVVVPPGFRSLLPFVPLHALAGPRPHRRCAFRAVTRSARRARRSPGARPGASVYSQVRLSDRHGTTGVTALRAGNALARSLLDGRCAPGPRFSHRRAAFHGMPSAVFTLPGPR
ncbi:PREDICTED: uncharacterized protein LOC105146352 isoform X2 [Acromyrmex echinatior]|uniref:uncharacterized protein LOC105146352 isoform X2 n=1 Tax=Acromyrmex echinatior TaxID=103372 RepID=UPI000580DDE6|nr:PREDICTED: uncharacterized protein LOC105146352 isoform X2 [Acromyrmex echinatior]